MNTNLPGRVFLLMSARSIPGEFSSRLHLRTHRTNGRAPEAAWFQQGKVQRENHGLLADVEGAISQQICS